MNANPDIQISKKRLVTPPSYLLEKREEDPYGNDNLKRVVYESVYHKKAPTFLK